jgi:3D (Asp-Asp-Asp) domain-containing protein
MNKYVSGIIKVICALIILLNISVMSLHLVKTDEEEKYNKTNYISYMYDIAKYDEKEDSIIKNQEKTQEEVKVEEKPAETVAPKEETKEPETTNTQYTVLDTFMGTITGYGPDCYGCSGIGNTSSGYNLITDGIYYPDKDFGQIRIVAADKSIPCGTVVRITGLKVYEQPFLAIVLDRGGAITGTKMDLAFTTEKDPLVSQIGLSKNIQYEVLRYGGIDKKC